MNNILIVDDTSANLQFLNYTLNKQGYRVHSAINGVVALKFAKKTLPDLILLDILMPEMNGYEVCEHLKADKQTRDIPIIFISALSETFDKAKAFTVGGVDYITKPFQTEDVLARVATHLKLRQMQTQLEAQNVQLQQEVLERKQAEETLRTAQSQLIQSEKLAALGQLVAGIAHEINTPLGAIRASSDNILASFNEVIINFPKISQYNTNQFQLFLAILEKSTFASSDLSSKENRTLKRKIRQRLDSENIEDASSFADLFIYMKIGESFEDFLPLLRNKEALRIVKSSRNFVSLHKNNKNITLAVDKAAKIVFALRKFAHQESSGKRTELDIIDSIETVLTLYYNQRKHGIEVIKQYQSLPLVSCYADDIQQVWTNLIHNALHAMQMKGTLTIEAIQSENMVIVSFTDTGCGIPDNIKSRIFEPFFTTKGRGEGSGLGLDIVKKIIDKHQGTIEVKSEIGKGTTFRIFLNIESGLNE